MRPDMNEPDAMVPMHPKDFQILFSLIDEPRHGYGIVKEVDRASGGRVRIDPANLYRSIRRMIGTGLVEEVAAPDPAAAEAERRRYYGITVFGLSVVRLEAKRLDDLASEARARRLIPESRSR
jgi:DNA-binding PadR family transcriptional regulator